MEEELTLEGGSPFDWGHIYPRSTSDWSSDKVKVERIKHLISFQLPCNLKSMGLMNQTP